MDCLIVTSDFHSQAQHSLRFEKMAQQLNPNCNFNLFFLNYLCSISRHLNCSVQFKGSKISKTCQFYQHRRRFEICEVGIFLYLTQNRITMELLLDKFASCIFTHESLG